MKGDPDGIAPRAVGVAQIPKASARVEDRAVSRPGEDEDRSFHGMNRHIAHFPTIRRLGVFPEAIEANEPYGQPQFVRGKKVPTHRLQH